MTDKIKCKAAILHQLGMPRPYTESMPLKIEEVEIDPPADGEILVKVKAAGLCHSDLSVINGNRPRPLPMALGHEGAGIVEAVGSGVINMKAGDHVVFIFVPPCGNCLACKEGKPALCGPGLKANTQGTLLSGAKKIKLKDNYINHHVGVSCFSEYAVVSSKSAVKIDKNLKLEEAALFGCAVITGAGAVFNTANIRSGSKVAVIGLGGTGLAALIGAKTAGASRIIGLDILNEKLTLATELGANLVIKANDDKVVDKLYDFTGGGVDYCFECVGSEKSMELGYKLLNRGGTLISSGLSHPDKKFSIQHVDLVAGEKSIKGSFLGSCVPDRDIPAYIDMYNSGILPVNKLVSQFINFEDINDGFEKLANGTALRQIISFS